jgi:hypothetical protein
VSWRPNGDRAESFAFFVSKKAGPKSFEAAPSPKCAMSHEALFAAGKAGPPNDNKRERQRKRTGAGLSFIPISEKSEVLD